MTYATVSDVATRLGRPISDPLEVAQVGAWIEDIESDILDRIPNLADLIVEGRPTTATVVRVESAAVIRKMKNPDGVVSEGNDVYNYRLNENARKGELFLTDEEWARLLPLDSTVSGVFSVQMYGDPDTALYASSPLPPASLDWA